MLWPHERAAKLNASFEKLFSKQAVTFSFVTDAQSRASRYFSDGLYDELSRFSPDPFVSIPADSDELPAADVVIFTTTGRDADAERLWRAREQLGDQSLLALWFWDNHVAILGNLNASFAADISFVSHAFAADYLYGPVSILSQHIPACSAQWTHEEADAIFSSHQLEPRLDQLLLNYVDYGGGYPERQRILSALTSSLEDADVLLMPKDDRTRYFSMSREQRFLEWMRYKATVIVPVNQDLSTRVFDALLAGLILIVPQSIRDFDLVIPPDVQALLGIVRVPDLELETVRQSMHMAFRRFDEMGLEGARFRHRYVLENHMLINRVTAMLEMVWRLGTGQLRVEFANGESGFALYQAQKQVV